MCCRQNHLTPFFSFCNFLDDREVLPFMSIFPVEKQHATTGWSEFGHCMKHLLDNWEELIPSCRRVAVHVSGGWTLLAGLLMYEVRHAIESSCISLDKVTASNFVALSLHLNHVFILYVGSMGFVKISRGLVYKWDEVSPSCRALNLRDQWWGRH